MTNEQRERPTGGPHPEVMAALWDLWDAMRKHAHTKPGCGYCGVSLDRSQWDAHARACPKSPLAQSLAAKDRRIAELERAIRKAIRECEGGIGSDAAKFFLRPAIGLDDYEEVPEEDNNGK